MTKEQIVKLDSLKSEFVDRLLKAGYRGVALYNEIEAHVTECKMKCNTVQWSDEKLIAIVKNVSEQQVKQLAI